MKLKYELPAVADLEKFGMDKFMVKRLVYDLMDMGSMPKDLKQVWDGIMKEADTDLDVEADENYGCGKDITSDEASTVTIYSSKSRSVASCNDPFNGSEVVGTD